MEKRDVFGFFFTCLLGLALFGGLETALAASGITYQGRLISPDGAPVVSPNVQFRLQIRSPGGQDCLMEGLFLQSMDGMGPAATPLIQQTTENSECSLFQERFFESISYKTFSVGR